VSPSEFLGYAARCIDCGLSIDHRFATHKLRTAQYLSLTLPTEEDSGIVDQGNVVLRFLLAAEIARSDGE